MDAREGTSTKDAVVVGFDATASSREALRWGVAEARTRDAILVVLHAGIDQTRGHHVLGEGLKLVEELGGGVEVRTKEVRASAASALSEAGEDAALVVVGEHRRGSLLALLSGSVGAGLSRDSLCPVMVVPPACVRGTGPVVVGVDGSAGSRHALEEAARSALREGVGLKVVLALETTEWASAMSAGWVSGAEAVLAREEAAKADAEEVRRWASERGVSAEVVLERQNPVGALLAHSEGATAVVVGTSGHGALMRAVTGSVGGTLMQKAHCPVLVAGKSHVAG
jgi:nucleotide-binding universal stress UspA family protein